MQREKEKYRVKLWAFISKKEIPKVQYMYICIIYNIHVHVYTCKAYVPCYYTTIIFMYMYIYIYIVHVSRSVCDILCMYYNVCQWSCDVE